MSKEANITIDDARALVSDAALWPRIRDFLWDFAPQIHGSWLETLSEGREGGSVSSLVSSLSSSPRAKRFILGELHVEPVFHSFPVDDASRLALLDGETLVGVAKWLGALACAEELRRVTDKATVHELKSSFPGVYPEVFSYVAYFPGLDQIVKKAKDATVPQKAVASGFALLFTALGQCPAPVVERLKMKLPRDFHDLCVPCGKKERPAAGSAVRKLVKLKFPEAYSLCYL